MRILAFGDLHGMLPKIFIKEFDIVVAPGDFCSEEIKKYFYLPFWWKIIKKSIFKKEIQKAKESIRNILKELNKIGKPVYVVPGNWDLTGKGIFENIIEKDYFKETIKGLRNIKNVHLKIKDIGKYQIIGYGISYSPNEEEKDYLKLRNLFEKATKPVIFLSHNVPYNTKLDKVGKNGSIIVRQIIEEYQPILSIAGHIHEHHKKCRIKKTICINTGYGNWRNTYIEINKKIKIKFINKKSFFQKSSGLVGFEPTTCWSEASRALQLRHRPNNL